MHCRMLIASLSYQVPIALLPPVVTTRCLLTLPDLGAKLSLGQAPVHERNSVQSEPELLIDLGKGGLCPGPCFKWGESSEDKESKELSSVPTWSPYLPL